jgi:hypothetical protein
MSARNAPPPNDDTGCPESLRAALAIIAEPRCLAIVAGVADLAPRHVGRFGLLRLAEGLTAVRRAFDGRTRCGPAQFVRLTVVVIQAWLRQPVTPCRRFVGTEPGLGRGGGGTGVTGGQTRRATFESTPSGDALGGCRRGATGGALRFRDAQASPALGTRIAARAA